METMTARIQEGPGVDEIAYDRSTGIESACERLAAKVEHVRRAVSLLEDRLVGVRVDRPAQAERLLNATPAPPRSPLAGRLESTADELADVAAWVERILESIDL